MKYAPHILLLLLWVVVQSSVILDHSSYIITFSLMPVWFLPDIAVLWDDTSKTFLSIVSLVAYIVILYSFTYIEGDVGRSNFVITLSLFCLSIVMLSLSCDVFWLIVGWDGLGFSSFCLILFYQNWKSVSGSLVTFLSNRFGDLFIICSVVLIFVLVNSGKPFSSDWLFILSVFLLLGGMTKSAQAPFSAWLPMAMAAPTPVSSLVHSSTLVTAGVYLLCRFNCVLHDTVLEISLLVSSVTILIAGSASVFEWDVNNVIALSTLLHIALIVYIISLGAVNTGLFHIQIHAFFKSLLFIGAGVIIHSSFNWQDLRQVGWNVVVPEWFILVSSILSMAGIPFLCGFFSNEIIIINTLSSDKAIFGPFWIGVFFTVVYSIRILGYCMNSESNISPTTGSVFSWVPLVLGGFLSITGSFLSWGWFSTIPFGAIFLDPSMKALLLFIVFIGIIVGITCLVAQDLKPAFVSVFWNVNSFVYFLVPLFCKGSWNCLNVCDSNGGLDWHIYNGIYNLLSTTGAIRSLIFPRSGVFLKAFTTFSALSVCFWCFLW